MNRTDLMLVYCDDPSHTANPVGPIITDPEPEVPDDVYIVAVFTPPAPGHTHWHGHDYATLKRGDKPAPFDEQVREALLGLMHRRAGTVPPPKADMFDEVGIVGGGARVHGVKWSPRCHWCDQRGGRWRRDDFDTVLTQLAQRGVTGIHEWVEVADVEFSGGPKLTNRRHRPNGRPWPKQAIERWEIWRRMPHCVTWRKSDWQFAFDAIEIFAQLCEKPEWPAFLCKELRDRERIMATTLDFRRAMRIRYLPVDSVPAPVPGEQRGVTDLDDYRNL
jgi:hypothetical protein